MRPLTDKQIRSSFRNASRRETTSTVLPDLSAVPWQRLDHLGWQDRTAPLSAYVVLELDGAPTRRPAAGQHRPGQRETT